jgi:hypothetical protein
MLLLIGIALLADEIALDGRYRKAVWQDTKQQGQQVNMKLKSWLEQYGL